MQEPVAKRAALGASRRAAGSGPRPSTSVPGFLCRGAPAFGEGMEFQERTGRAELSANVRSCSWWRVFIRPSPYTGCLEQHLAFTPSYGSGSDATGSVPSAPQLPAACRGLALFLCDPRAGGLNAQPFVCRQCQEQQPLRGRAPPRGPMGGAGPGACHRSCDPHPADTSQTEKRGLSAETPCPRSQGQGRDVNGLRP